jgi:F420-dependent oxidoreductase-like protein
VFWGGTVRLGVYLGGDEGVAATIDQVSAAARLGFESVFFRQVDAWDAVTLAALSAHSVPGIDVGTAVVPTYPRHPLALAGQALTAQAASGNRFILGIGPSHRPLIEGQYGLSYDRPAAHIREYLSALRPLLHGEEVRFRGETLTVNGRTELPDVTPPPVLLAALGPVMLRIAGELADGTVTVWTEPETIAEHIAPALRGAASAAGRPAPQIVAAVIVNVTDAPEETRRRVEEQYGAAGQLSSYRSLLDKQGKSGIAETVVAGGEDVVARAIRDYADAGATELLVSPFGTAEERARTLKVVASLRTEAR